MYDSLLKTGNEKYKTAVLEEQNHSYANQTEGLSGGSSKG